MEHGFKNMGKCFNFTYGAVVANEMNQLRNAGFKTPNGFLRDTTNSAKLSKIKWNSRPEITVMMKTPSRKKVSMMLSTAAMEVAIMKQAPIGVNLRGNKFDAKQLWSDVIATFVFCGLVCITHSRKWNNKERIDSIPNSIIR